MLHTYAKNFEKIELLKMYLLRYSVFVLLYNCLFVQKQIVYVLMHLRFSNSIGCFFNAGCSITIIYIYIYIHKIFTDFIKYNYIYNHFCLHDVVLKKEKKNA